MGPLPDLRRTAVPLGPVAVFTASNFPFAFGVPGGDTASALAAGCPVVVKTHPSHPGLSAELARVVAHALERAGAPRGVFASVSGVAAGRRLITHPAIRAAAFTGSLAGGRALLDLANSRPDPIPFYGELGSLNPVVVTPAAAMARAAEIGRSWVESMTLGGGQFCTKPGLLLVPSAAADDVAGAAAAALAEVGAPVLLNTAIRDRFDGGVDLLRGYGRELLCAEASFLEGLAVQPVVARRTAQEALQQPHVLDEVFGPVGIVVEYTGFDEVVAVLGRIGGSLTVTVHGEQDDPDASGAVELAASMAGRVVWNGFPTGVAVSRSMQHGGPWPASTSSRDTSVGSAAIRRFVRPVTYQGLPDALLPPELRAP